MSQRKAQVVTRKIAQLQNIYESLGREPELGDE